MIVLWVLSMIVVLTFILVAFYSRANNEGQGAIKWLVIAMLLLVFGTLIWMGVKIWLRN